jgi:16S rRNA (guanine(966)-N(2))-methyltransferase RsmD
MRIIAGKFRGRSLHAVGAAPLRPTSDRLRETLFDVLSAARQLEGTTWLDLFAGTGAVGIEALSRGAAKVYFVESARSSLALLQKNLGTLAITEAEAEVLPIKAFEAINRLAKRLRPSAFDMVFLDPPYEKEDEYARVLEAVAASGLLKDDSLVIAEHSKRFAPLAQVNTLQRYRLLKQGDAALSFYRF